MESEHYIGQFLANEELPTYLDEGVVFAPIDQWHSHQLALGETDESSVIPRIIEQDIEIDTSEEESKEEEGLEEKKSSPVKQALNETSTEDEGQICSICFEPWTSSSEHRLVSLRCGHLFGRSCIGKWLRGQGSRCPQCNARARKSEIRPIYAKCLKVLDTSERDRALRELEKESQLRKKAELECAQMRLRYQMVVNECEVIKKQLMQTQILLNESRSTNKCDAPAAIGNKMPFRSFTMCSVIDLNGGCRILGCNDMLGLMAVSQQSNNQIFKGYGLRKISIPDMRVCEYVHLHQKPIKDISFHSHNGLVLTASLDKTLKLTNCLNNSLVQTYNLDCEAWSCAWDLDDPCYFYAGVRTGAVYIFDIRMTDRHVEQLTSSGGEPSPAISIQYIKRQPNASFSKCGLFLCQLSSCFYYDKQSVVSFDVNQIPLEGKFTSLSYESTTNHILASCRPSLKHARVTHTLCEVSFQESFQCNLVQSMTGGCTQVQLARSKLIPHPNNDSSVLVCAGDEEAKAALIWDGNSGNLIDSLKADFPVLDLMTFREDHKPLLATLTEKNLRIYNWNQT